MMLNDLERFKELLYFLSFRSHTLARSYDSRLLRNDGLTAMDRHDATFLHKMLLADMQMREFSIFMNIVKVSEMNNLEDVAWRWS